MAKKEKAPARKVDASGKKGESDSGKSRKTDKERFKGKGKWTGSVGGDDDLGAELAALGLRIKEITGDGNCFFRALGDQLQGDERQHVQIRQRIVSYMVDQQDDFAPFVEDDESFESYIARMKKDGVWAGYMEVVAASRCLGVNLTIYQAGQPRWRVINHPEAAAPMLHLSYHDGQHYNSVRCADDYGTGPPAPVVIRGDGTMAARPARDGSWDEKDERRVASSTACTDMALVRKALEEARGDVEAAIERVIEALAAAPDTSDAPEPAGGKPSEADVSVAAPASPEARSSTAPAAPDRDAGGVLEAHPGGAGEGRNAGPASVAAIGEAAASGACDSRAGKEPTPREEGERDGVGGGGGADGRATGEPEEDGRASAAAGAAATAGVGSIGARGAAPAAAKGVRVLGPKLAVGKGAAARRAAAAAAAPSNNKLCPCGSKKKYKVCCGPAAAAAERRRAAAGDAAAAGSQSQSDTRVLVAQVAALVI